MDYDYAFEIATSRLRFGRGVTREVGMDLADLGARRVLIVTDANLATLPPVATVLESLTRQQIRFALFDRVRVEPTDDSFREAIAAAQSEPFDAFVAVGGGSAMDTAKAANLYSTYPADLLEYVNAPIGKAQSVPGPLKPLIAIPTTAGTGSETTGVAVFDLVARHAKTGISQGVLKPTLGLVDPENTKTMPPMLTASTGFDVFVHALESYTTIHFDRRQRPERPKLRPAYQGSNPISDLWAAEAARVAARYLPRAVENPDDDEARSQMLLAASYAGIGFGSAGLHLPHAMSYGVSGMVRDYRPPGYTVAEPLIPHGMAVVLTAPAAFRFTGPALPERHLQAAEWLGVDVSRARPADAGKILAAAIVEFMRRLHVPNGLVAVGYTRGDIPGLVEAALAQQRLTKLSPQPVGPDELTQLFEDSLVIW